MVCLFFHIEEQQFIIETHQCPARHTRSYMQMRPDIQAMAPVASEGGQAISIYMQA